MSLDILFRLVAPRTAGRTTTFTTIPPISERDNAKDIFTFNPSKAADLLYNHLKWIQGHEGNCNLMSWTISLLFAIQYGLYRHVTDWDKPDLTEIFLVILDTHGFPEKTFVNDLELMQIFKTYSDDLNNFWGLRRSEFYFGEYLTQGELQIEGHCAQISLQRMIDLGLFELHPDLGKEEEWRTLARRVVKLRQSFAISNPPPTTKSEVRKAITIAQGCFGDRWAIPFAVMLLALRPRRQDDPVIVKGFAAMFAAEEIAAFHFGDIKIHASNLPEVTQFANLISSIRRELPGDDVRSLLNPFAALGLDLSCLRA